MRYETLHSYIMLCKLYGWQPSMVGLLAYEWQLVRGMRFLWGSGLLPRYCSSKNPKDKRS